RPFRTSLLLSPPEREGLSNSLGIITEYPFRHTHRLVTALDFEGNAHSYLHAAGHILDVVERRPGTHAFAYQHGRGEAELIQSVIHAHSNPLDGPNLTHQVRRQGQSIVPVCHRPTEGRFFLRTIHVDVNPLVIVRRVGEGVNLCLRHQVPVGDPEFLSDQRLDVFKVNYASSHGYAPPSLPREADSRV